MIADDVGVVLEVEEHFLVAPFAMTGAEAAGDLDGVTGPVEGGGGPEEGPAAAIEQAADDAVLGVIVGGLRVCAGVEAGEAFDPLPKAGIVGGGEAQQVEGGETFGIVEPIHRHREFSIVHAIAGHGDLRGPGEGVLPEVSFIGALKEFEGLGAPPKGVEQGPVVAVFDGIVGTIVASPPLDAEQVATVVEVAFEELATAIVGSGEQFSLQECPGRRREWGLDDKRRIGGNGWHGGPGTAEGSHQGQDRGQQAAEEQGEARHGAGSGRVRGGGAETGRRREGREVRRVMSARGRYGSHSRRVVTGANVDRSGDAGSKSGGPG